MAMNAVYKHEKLDKLFDLLQKNPETTVDEIVRNLNSSQFKLSMYEKLFVLKAQLSYVELLLRNYGEKMKRDSRHEGKFRRYEVAREKLVREIESTQSQFDFLFKKPLPHYYY